MTAEELHRYLADLPFWMLRDLARGPMPDEPHCGVCQVMKATEANLWHIVRDMDFWEHTAFVTATISVWDWHDTDDRKWDDELWKKEMYYRCLIIYSAAVSEMTRRADLESPVILTPPSWLGSDIDGFARVVEFHSTPEAAPLLRVA